MGKRGGKQRAPILSSGHQGGITLREESSGRKQNKGVSGNAKSTLKLQHLQKLAVWASVEASVPSLGAFFGHRLAACGEAMGVPPDPSLFSCQRCESILQPGFNCTVRIEKNRVKVKRRHKKPKSPMQNNVVYKCHFCSHQNLTRGTPKGHMKEICPPKLKPPSKSAPANPKLHESADSEIDTKNTVEAKGVDEIASPVIASDTPLSNSPATPSVTPILTLLQENKRKRNRSSASKKQAESDSNIASKDAEKEVTTSSKRRRKSWTSLKKIAESSEHDNGRNITTLTIPFFL